MSYLVQSYIAASPTMSERVAQCAAEQHQPDPDMWMIQHRREWAAAPGWADAWTYAIDTHPPPDPPDPSVPPYDPGADEAVITDPMILAQVQSMLPADIQTLPMGGG